MNKFFLKVSQNNGETTDLPCHLIEVKNAMVVVSDFLLDHPIPLLFEVKHSQINTLFDLTKVTPYEIWFFYFEKDEVSFGKSFSLGNGETPFQIQTQAKFIVIVPCNYKDLNQKKIDASSKYIDIKINNSYLPDTHHHKSQIEDWSLKLLELSDQELINTFNKETGITSWGEARSLYLLALQSEILNRSFNSDILFEYNENGSVLTFLIKTTVQINKDILEFKNN